MSSYTHISTGHKGIDEVVDSLRIGDNVVWQTDSIEDFAALVTPFVEQALKSGRKIVYFRFGKHRELLRESDNVQVCQVDPALGFESFATNVYRMITNQGMGAFFVFDSLTDLLHYWGSDLMVMNFFKVTCPYLYELDTVAYFCLLRGQHSFESIAGIRNTTQLLLDLHRINEVSYIHAHKVWSRHSPTMFFPHRLEGQNAVPVTSSAQTSELFSRITQEEPPLDPWRSLLQEATIASKDQDIAKQKIVKEQLLSLLIGREGPMVDLAHKYLSLQDLLTIASRRIGSGRIGGKSVGMLVAGAVVGQDEYLSAKLEQPDSFYLGSDLFFTYIIDNGWWKDWMEQKTADGYFSAGARLHEKLLHGQFPSVIRERFLRLLEYYGQFPIIVRSSSLLEDNFGNAFSGKYESCFCANQGNPDERLRAFEDAVRIVYASTMGTDALHYRRHRDLGKEDEQMAILVQRVSGKYHGPLFFPNAAGVGNSHNLYVFSSDIDPTAGALRLVVGLGTRAVDRLGDDYAWLVALDNPQRLSIEEIDVSRYSQKLVDVLNLSENEQQTLPLRDLQDLDANWQDFLSRDRALISRLRQLGRQTKDVPLICDFAPILSTNFPNFMRRLLDALRKAYDYPVDIEFTVNMTQGGDFRVCLVQCRPLQTRGLGNKVSLPTVNSSKILFSSSGNFLGGNTQLPIDKVIFVRPSQYLQLSEQDRYEVAVTIGKLNNQLQGQNVMAIGPGRWGTSTSSLGVPAHFAQISNMSVLVEITDPTLDFNVDLSFGSHFFSDLVESGIFFAAIDQMRPNVTFNSNLLLVEKNLLPSYCPESRFSEVIHVVSIEGLEVFADVINQNFLCAKTN